MHDAPTTADLAYSTASDNAKLLKVIAKRLDLLKRALTRDPPILQDEFEKLWAEADPPPPPPIDYSNMPDPPQYAYPGYGHRTLLGDK